MTTLDTASGSAAASVADFDSPEHQAKQGKQASIEILQKGRRPCLHRSIDRYRISCATHCGSDIFQ